MSIFTMPSKRYGFILPPYYQCLKFVIPWSDQYLAMYCNIMSTAKLGAEQTLANGTFDVYADPRCKYQTLIEEIIFLPLDDKMLNKTVQIGDLLKKQQKNAHLLARECKHYIWLTINQYITVHKLNVHKRWRPTSRKNWTAATKRKGWRMKRCTSYYL